VVRSSERFGRVAGSPAETPGGTDQYDQPMDEETEILLRFLDQQRNHVLGILEGLSEEQLRRPVLPSGWNCLGLVKHLSLDVEHYWFRCITGGESLDLFSRASDGSGAWEVQPSESADDILNLYRDEIERAKAIIAITPLDTPPAQRDQWWGDWEVPNFRYTMLHVIAETATHAGHTDAARELIDGRQWIVL
jgi:hypothetical protein